MRVLDLRLYQALIEIAQRGTFTAAARHLHISQSVLSARIRQLERACGCQLLVRTRSGARLTPAGRYLLPLAEDLLRRAEGMQRGLEAFLEDRRDCLRMGTILGPSQTWLPAAIAEFSRRQPRCQIHIQVLTSPPGISEITAKVARGELDLGIVTVGRIEEGQLLEEDFERRLLIDEEMVVLVPSHHPLAAARQIPLSHLRDLPLVALPEGYTLRRIIDNSYRKSGIRPRIVSETGSIDIACNLVSQGLGIAIVPRTLALTGLRMGLRIVSIAAADPPRRKVIAFHRPDHAQITLLRHLSTVLARHAAEAERRARALAAS
ncbi:MAG TPA: LysR family transcriptional regulator [Candidatus Dormibacteraeota bacterium]|nr:LysR family transcriptional regulator [Candidatus Dormibacteraeota bacterium]